MSAPLVRAETAVAPVAGLQVCARELGLITEAVLDCLGLTGAAVEVRLAGDAEVAGLNASFRRLSGPTNVLSFPAYEEEGEGGGVAPSLGQVVISRDAVLREARLYGQEPLAHLVRLLAHGLLHLAGEEHGPDMEERTQAAVDRVSASI